MGRAYLSVCARAENDIGQARRDRRYPIVRKIAGWSETWKSNFKPTTVERFELGKGDLGGALPRSELTGSEARSDDPRVGSVLVGFTD
jgi:hypothetical protein